MKILHVAETIKGGIATFFDTFETVCGPNEGIENRYLVPDAQVDQLRPDLARAVFPRRRRGVMGVLGLAHAAHREAWAFRPDVLWFHSTFSFAAMAWLRARGVPGHYVYTAHGWCQMREEGRKRAVLSGIERQLTRLPDLVVNISANDRALAQASGYAGPQLLIENALPDLGQWPAEVPFATGPDRLNLLYVGRFERQKGLDILLEAFATAAARNPRLHLHVVGSGGDGPEAAAQGAHSQVTFHSWVPSDRIAAFYRAADLLVMPSRWEGLPMVLIESLRAGTPVMVSEASGLPGLIEPGSSGLVTPLDPDAMAQALSRLDRARLTAMRGAARTLFERRYSAPLFRARVFDALRVFEPAPEGLAVSRQM